MDRRGFLMGGSALALAGCAGDKGEKALKPAPFSGRFAARDRLLAKLKATGHRYGSAVHFMIYKETSELEVWLQGKDGTFRQFANYSICAFSGGLGPKLRRGDAQTPEGFYEIEAKHLNPWSSYHLAVDIGYPNRYDRLQRRTGSLIEIHGACLSIGCYSMGDTQMEDIYLLVEQAFLQGEKRATLASYPFRPTPERMEAAKGHVWYDFWKNIFGSHDMFMAHKKPPYYDVLGNKYVFTHV